jgi:hypothetical protein
LSSLSDRFRAFACSYRWAASAKVMGFVQLILPQKEFGERLLRGFLCPLSTEPLVLFSIKLDGEAPRGHLDLVPRGAALGPDTSPHPTVTHNVLPVCC